MGIALILLAAIAGLIVVLLIAGLFMKKEYSIEQEITINKPKQAVFDYIKQVKNHQNYNKWWMRDPNAKKTYTGVDGAVGFIAAWDSDDKHAGKGEQEIIAIADGQKIEHEIRFEKPFKGTAHSYQATKAINNEQTKVNWVFYGVNKYPVNLMSKLLNLNGVLGKELYESLESLKGVLEK